MTHLPAAAVVSAATHLMRAGHWPAATALLSAAHPDNKHEHLTLALAQAEAATDQDFAQQTDHAPAATAAAEAALAASTSPAATSATFLEQSWDLAMMKLRKDYSTVLFGSRADGGELARRARELIADAPDDARRGAVTFYAGVMADNVYERPDEAFAHYTTAYQLGEKSGDDLLRSLALRHLGDHARTAGDLALARQHWERSTELRQKVGHLLGALAQQTLLAVLLRDEGDTAGSRALATEVNRWATQVDLRFIVRETAALMD
jgi:tetratricopeptide (TPR) repeat protein